MTRVYGIPTSRTANFIKFQRDPLGFLVDALPMGDVVSLRTSSLRPTFVVNSPDFVQEILVHQEQHFRKGRSSNVLRRTIGDGLLTSEHSVHKQQKKYLIPVFYKERIQTYAQIVRDETLRLADSLEEGQPVPMHEIMMQLTLGIIARSLFNTELAGDKAELAEAVDVTIRQSAGTIFSPIILPFSVPTPGNVRHKRAIRTLEAMIYETISKAKQDPEAYADTMLGLLLDTKDESGGSLSDQEIRDQMMTMLLAGHETTANALVWAWYCLERTPDALHRMYAELNQIREKEEQSGQQLTAYEHYREMSFTKQIVQETLRLYPPAWAILRESNRALDMLGDHFPNNSSFLISPYAIHRNDKVFGDASSFRPDRFDGGVSQWARFAYFPFGGGSRGCIGSQFALLEAGLIMGTLAEKFEFTSSPGQGEAIPEPLVSLRIKNGRWMVPKRR
ncbi:cytochrome P450 [Cohnella abietis]|uniref:Cytochrome P450 n=1 Tax=Cohnella abietis TaxID=2507935 RepID=A0A3T1CZT2_9BACL|nr:cytochrome P450 [Cohnella abietis]BBI31353.1 cytochrome P450 [Cohnella abietis]